MSKPKEQSTEPAVREIRRWTLGRLSPEEEIRIVPEGPCRERSVTELCRREGIATNLYYRWSKDSVETDKRQLADGTSGRAEYEQTS
jgi:transposase